MFEESPFEAPPWLVRSESVGVVNFADAVPKAPPKTDNLMIKKSFTWNSRIRHLLQRLGWDFHRYPTTRMTVILRRSLLKSLEIRTFLDVGANTGEFAEDVRKDGFNESILSFEPLSSAFDELMRRSDSDVRWECFNCAVGRENGTAVIHVAGNSVSSSLLPMAELHSSAAPDSVIKFTEKVSVRRLSDICDERKPEFPAYLKIDTQGYELEVLRGAESHLTRIPAIELEVSISELYKGQPLFPDVHQFLENHGYYLASLEEGFVDREINRILQAECIYLRKGSI